MASLAINVVIAVGSVLAWLSILLGSGDDRQLAQRGIGSLKYYTVLSNLFSAGVSAAYALCFLIPGAAPSRTILFLKLAATATVMITFATTAVLLVPMYGWKALYQGGNFWLHLVLPLIAALDICLFVPVATLPLWATLGSVCFTAAYAAWYMHQVLTHGAERDGKVYDFYGFLRWGKESILWVAAIMLLATWAFAVLLYVVSSYR